MFRRELKKQFNENKYNVLTKQKNKQLLRISQMCKCKASLRSHEAQLQISNCSFTTAQKIENSGKAKYIQRKPLSGGVDKKQQELRRVYSDENQSTKAKSDEISLFNFNACSVTTASVKQAESQVRKLKTIIQSGEEDIEEEKEVRQVRQENSVEDAEIDQSHRFTEEDQIQESQQAVKQVEPQVEKKVSKPVAKQQTSLLSLLTQHEADVKQRSTEQQQPVPKAFADDDEDDFKTTNNKQNAEEGILKIAYYLSKNSLTLREVYEALLFDDFIDGKEFELLEIREFSEVAQTLMNLEEKHVQAISIMMAEHFIGDSFNFKFLEEIFKQMGFKVKEQETVAELDNKSMRILKRLSEFLAQNEDLNLEQLLEKDIRVQKIKVKGQLIDVKVVNEEAFFKFLHLHKLRKSALSYQNLSSNFLLHKSLKGLLQISKLQKCISQLTRSTVYQKFGTMKRQKTTVEQRAKGDFKKFKSQEISSASDMIFSQKQNEKGKEKTKLTTVEQDYEESYEDDDE